MKLSQVKSVLKELETIGFQLPNGELVPNHFHVTEVGKITKHFIDCGGTERKEEVDLEELSRQAKSVIADSKKTIKD